MAALIAQNLAPIMFAALVIFLLLGYPVAFSLAANGLLFFALAVELAPYAPQTITLSWPLLQALPDRIYGTMANEVLLAIPFFTFMGLILLGFVLLFLQWASEFIKRVAIMRGELEDVHAVGGHQAAAEAEAERLLTELAATGTVETPPGTPEIPPPQSGVSRIPH